LYRYHEDDEYGSAGNIPSGKGERLVMLTAIAEEIGMLGNQELLDTLMLFQAAKPTGDYDKNMNADMFCKWIEEQLFTAGDRMGISPVLILDNASYHCTPAPRSINVSSFITKTQCTAILDEYNVPYRQGTAPRGDNLIQLKAILKDWLKDNAAEHSLVVNKTRLSALCEARGFHNPIFTPPYHPELQPIERLWRDVKMFVARQFVGGRTVAELREQVLAGFRKYGTREACVGRMEEAFEWERKYREEGVYAEVVDLTGLDDETDDDGDSVHDEDGINDNDGGFDADDHYGY
jgi:hypothetical protein